MTSSLTSPTRHAAGPRPLLPNIAFVGKAGAGKSSAAALLVQAFGYQPISFAEPLKDIAVQLWGEQARTDRAKLQGLGTAVREIEDEDDTWVRLLIHKVKANPEAKFVVDDCRFENELWALRGMGFVIVRVVSDRLERIDRLKRIGKLQDEAQLEHVSETALDDQTADHEIKNDWSVDQYHDAIAALLSKELRRR